MAWNNSYSRGTSHSGFPAQMLSSRMSDRMQIPCRKNKVPGTRTPRNSLRREYAIQAVSIRQPHLSRRKWRRLTPATNRECRSPEKRPLRYTQHLLKDGLVDGASNQNHGTRSRFPASIQACGLKLAQRKIKLQDSQLCSTCLSSGKWGRRAPGPFRR